MGHVQSTDYAKRAKQGFLAGTCLFLVGALGELLAHTYVSLPAWEETLLFDAIVLGTLIALLSVLVFGIVLPLAE